MSETSFDEEQWACPWCAEKDKRIKELEERIFWLKDELMIKNILTHIEKEQKNDEEK